METGKMKLSDIIPAEYNPRVTLVEGSTEYDALKNSIERFGLVDPLIVNKRNNVLVGGHQRYNILKDSGATEAEVVFVDLNEEDEKTLNIALNKIEGDWEFDKLEAVLKELSVYDISFTGFSEEDVRNIVGINEEEALRVIEGSEEDDTEEDTEKAEASEKEFVMYFSFDTKEQAEAFLLKHGLGEKFDQNSKILNIKMEA